MSIDMGMTKGTKFQEGDEVTVNIASGSLIPKWGRYQHLKGTIKERVRSGADTMYRVDFGERSSGRRRSVLIPSQILYKGPVVYPMTAHEVDQGRLAKQLRHLKPGDRIRLAEYPSALAYDDDAIEASCAGNRPSGGDLATIKQLGRRKVIQVDDLPGLWKLPYISTTIITEVLNV